MTMVINLSERKKDKTNICETIKSILREEEEYKYTFFPEETVTVNVIVDNYLLEVGSCDGLELVTSLTSDDSGLILNALFLPASVHMERHMKILCPGFDPDKFVSDHLYAKDMVGEYLKHTVEYKTEEMFYDLIERGLIY